MREPVGLFQPTSGLHHFKASFLECPQRMESIYFPSWFYSRKAYSWLYLCSHQPLARGPWKLFPRGEHSERCGFPWLTSHPWPILFPPGNRPTSPCVHVSARFPERMGWSNSELSPVTGKTKARSPTSHAVHWEQGQPVLCVQYVFKHAPFSGRFCGGYLFRVLASKRLVCCEL